MDRTVKILVILFAVVGIGLLGYHWINQWHDSAVEKIVNKEKQACLNRISLLEAQIDRQASELGLQAQPQPSKSDLANAFGADKPMTAIASETTDCDLITAQVVAFFQYLDSKAYLIWPGINMRAEELFDETLRMMAATPPTNVGEMEDLYSLVRNVTHFYRVLGKDRIDLIKEILTSEAGVTEPAMAVMYSWLTVCAKPKGNKGEQSNLNTLYQYASFFLNTLGGRSYLLRRESKLRMLVNYYSILTMDLANDAKLNSYGIDIRPHLDYVFYDINNQKGLLYRQRYLSRLAALQTKYQ